MKLIKELAATLMTLSLSCAAPAQIAWVSYPRPVFQSGNAFYGPAFDTARQRLLAVGFSSQAPGVRLEVQQRVGIQWQPIGAPVDIPNSPVTVPAVVAYDHNRDRVVLIDPNGGVVEWNGSAWSIASPNLGSPQVFGRGCYDPVRQRVIVSRQSSTPGMTETWEWDGVAWFRILLAQELPADFRAIAYNPSVGRLIALAVSGTWELHGGTWIQVGPPPSSSPLFGALMDYDATGGQIICSISASDQFAWNGTSWDMLRISGFVILAAQYTASTPLGIAAYNSSQFVMSVRAPTASIVLLGPGCPGAVGPVTLTVSEPALGIFGPPFTYDIGGLSGLPFSRAWVIVGFDRNQIAGLPLPLDLSSFNMPGCFLRESIDMLIPVVGTSGAISIPNDYTFLGLPFYVQALVQDFGANGPVMALSEAYEGIVGVRL